MSIMELINALLSLEMLIAAFAGGAFGAAIGGLPSFVLCGFMVIAGEAIEYVDPGTTTFTAALGFGPVFGPHISFAGGAAATAYAAKRGYINTEYDYHQGKNIAYALGIRPDVLVVGGAFGILGYWITTTSGTLTLPWDPIAIAVVLSGVAHRLVFRYPLIGSHDQGLLNMSPFEDEERHVIGEPAVDGTEAATDGGTANSRLVVEPWLAHQYKWGQVAALGLVVGVLGAFIAVRTGSPYLGFGISAASLVFLNCGVANIPVTHHMTITSSTIALAVTSRGDAVLAGMGMTGALVLGGILSMIVALFAELFQRIFYAHSDTHLDPPAAAIVFGTVVIAGLEIGRAHV